MRISLLLAFLLCTPPLLAGTPATAPAAATMEPAAVANHLLDLLDAGRFEEAAEPFTDGMRAAVGPAQLAQVWNSLPPASDRGQPRIERTGGLQIVRITLGRGITQWTALTAVDAQGRIAGFRVTPIASAIPVPAVPADATYTERDMTVGVGDHALPGVLTMPKKAGKRGVPAVVLVHGSGPQDRNETIEANRPFLDLARGLAERGIASLRYDKRTAARPQEFTGEYSVDDETTNDAVAALAALRGVPNIDAKRLYVLGHSQGGMLAPRIALHAGKGKVAGLVLLAAPSRSLLELIPEQVRGMAMDDGKVSAEEQAALDSIAADITRIRSSAPAAPGEQTFGAPLGYWRAFDAIDPVADARRLGPPMLLLQGGRDAQVATPDWQRWRDAFDNRPCCTLKEYPSLNHLGISGEGPPSVREYATPGHVDAALIADIADWITAR